ncbi:MAG: hypothetical protein ABI687_02030, partial [Flavitalea sp.]
MKNLLTLQKPKFHHRLRQFLLKQIQQKKRQLLTFLLEQQGCVANIGSTNSLGGERNLLAYSVSKGALLTLSKNLADALGP